MNKTILTTSIIILISSCSTTRLGEQKSLGLNIKSTITATTETTPTPQGKEDDSADDPAIWIHPKNPAESLIFGTDKMGGIATYTLEGKEVNYEKLGRINNIDIRQNVKIHEGYIDVLAGTNRSTNNIVIGTIDSQGIVEYQDIQGTENLKNKEVYGFALGLINDQLHAFVNDKSGNIFIYALSFDHKTWTIKLSKTLRVKSQPEGMVVDDDLGFLYVGEEENTVWKINLKDYSFNRIAKSSEHSNEFIKYDIEGLALYKINNKEGYLVVSSQGNNSFAVFSREGNNAYIKSFRIVDGLVDSVEETDGLDLSNQAFSSQFPKGIMVVQDGFNYDGKKKKSQNFKIVDWRAVENIIKE